ncbi:MAG: hypothetical protein HC884_15475 [Chloroflexaceae bacterium]|nr:hypothetical protein [Chloroflexaceae bacterium]
MNEPTRTTDRGTWGSLVLALFAVATTVGILSLALWNRGTSVSPDAVTYLQTAVNFFLGRGLTMPTYHPATDVMTSAPTTHYPPLLPFIYGLEMFVGIPSSQAPVIVSLVGWVALLSGMGVLTYRLGTSPLVAALVVALAAFYPDFWLIFSHTLSEVVFLPLLVWLHVILVDLPTRSTRKLPRLAGAAVVLALLILTRHVGVVVLAGVLLWWGWWHLAHRQVRWLVGGGAILASAVLPYALWVVANTGQTSSVAGWHFRSSDDTFIDGVAGIVESSIQALVPLTPFHGYLHHLGLATMLLLTVPYLGIFGAAGVALWRHRPARIPLLTPYRSPLLLVLCLYLALYLVVQPFLSFTPLDNRDMTTITCLFIPWVAGALAHLLPARWASALIGGYVALNVAITLLLPVSLRGIPAWWTTPPERVTEHPYDQSWTPFTDRFGFLAWFEFAPYKTNDLADFHPDLTTWLQSMAPGERGEVLVLVNQPGRYLFAPHPGITIGDLQGWLDAGSCASQYPAVVVIFDADTVYYPEDEPPPAQLYQAVQQKCPDLPKQVFEHSTVYQLVAEE